MSNRIKQLDGLRFILAIIIVFSHIDYLGEIEFTKGIYDFLINSSYAVDCFFVLSGFGLYYKYHVTFSNKKIGIINSIKFAIKRISKIYPFYLLSLIVSMPLLLYNTYFFTNHILKSTFYIFIKCGVCTILCQTLTGIKDFTHAINAVCWFISSLFICYILCPFLIKKIDKIKNKKKLLSYSIIIFFIFILANYTSLLIDRKGISIFGYTINMISYEHPFVRIWYLTIGMLSAKTYILVYDNKKVPSTLEFFILFISLAFYLYGNIIENYIVYMLMKFLIFYMLITILALGEGKLCKILSSELLTKLSSLSMYVYLFHYPINQILGTIIFKNEIYFKSHMYLYAIFFVTEIFLDILIVFLINKNKERIKNSKFLNLTIYIKNV